MAESEERAPKARHNYVLNKDACKEQATAAAHEDPIPESRDRAITSEIGRLDCRIFRRVKNCGKAVLRAACPKTGRGGELLPVIAVFVEAFKPKRTMLVGSDLTPIEEFLLQPVERWDASG